MAAKFQRAIFTKYDRSMSSPIVTRRSSIKTRFNRLRSVSASNISLDEHVKAPQTQTEDENHYWFTLLLLELSTSFHGKLNRYLWGEESISANSPQIKFWNVEFSDEELEQEWLHAYARIMTNLCCKAGLVSLFFHIYMSCYGFWAQYWILYAPAAIGYSIVNCCFTVSTYWNRRHKTLVLHSLSSLYLYLTCLFILAVDKSFAYFLFPNHIRPTGYYILALAINQSVVFNLPFKYGKWLYMILFAACFFLDGDGLQHSYARYSFAHSNYYFLIVMIIICGRGVESAARAQFLRGNMLNKKVADLTTQISEYLLMEEKLNENRIVNALKNISDVTSAFGMTTAICRKCNAKIEGKSKVKDTSIIAFPSLHKGSSQFSQPRSSIHETQSEESWQTEELIRIVKLAKNEKCSDLSRQGSGKALGFITTTQRKGEPVNTGVERLINVMKNANKRLSGLMQDVENARELSDRLIQDILPKSVADHLKQGNVVPPENYSRATVFFSDIRDFTLFASTVTPTEVMILLHEVYVVMDTVLSFFPVYKVETIGDAYMVAGGLPYAVIDETHATSVANFALTVLRAIRLVHKPNGDPVEIRIGIHSGPVVAGVVGLRMPRYCLFGDTVNTASRMESTGFPSKIHVSAETAEILQRVGYKVSRREGLQVKGKGKMQTYLLEEAPQNCNSFSPDIIDSALFAAENALLAHRLDLPIDESKSVTNARRLLTLNVPSLQRQCSTYYPSLPSTLQSSTSYKSEISFQRE